MIFKNIKQVDEHYKYPMSAEWVLFMTKKEL